MLGQRVIYQDHYATVKYIGPIVHEDKGSDIWVGVEWDEPGRGRHNGSVNGHVYFTTKKGAYSGSLLKKDKVIHGVNILDAIFQKYFKEIPQNLQEVLDKELVQKLQELDTTNSVIHQNIQKQADEIIQSQDPDSKYVTVASQKQVLVEFDHNAFFETSKKHKKMVEFYGFNEIWKKINNLKMLQELSLQSQFISSIGKFGFLKCLLPNLKILSLEKNLIFSWQQVFLIGYELSHLQELILTQNSIQPLESYEYLLTIAKKDQNQVTMIDEKIEENKMQEEMVQPKKELYNQKYRIMCTESLKFLDFNPLNLFLNLKVLVLINMNLTWKDINQIIPVLSNIHELVLCRNDLSDYENLVILPNEIQNLKKLNLEETNSNDFQKIQNAFGHLHNLENLTLTNNQIKELDNITGFQNLQSITLEGNQLGDAKFLSQLSILQKLTSLNLKHNPIQNKLGQQYVRQRAIAEIGSLQIMNGSFLSKFERKDSEIFYMKSAFEEYFAFKKVPHYYYDYDNFLQYAQIRHPRIPYLIKKYGNPYEIDPTVKPDEVQQFQVQKTQKSQYITVKIIALSGKFVGKAPIVKKFMYSTGIFPIKQVVSRLFSLPLQTTQVSIKIDSNSEPILMNEKDKTLEYYGAVDDSQILVSEVK